MLLSIIDFHLFYDGAVDKQIWAPPTRSQCKVCDTQVTVKACGPLVFFVLSNYWYQVQPCQYLTITFIHIVRGRWKVEAREGGRREEDSGGDHNEPGGRIPPIVTMFKIGLLYKNDIQCRVQYRIRLIYTISYTMYKSINL